MSAQLLHVALMLVLTLGLFVGLMYFVKRIKTMGPGWNNSIEILGGASISHKGKVILIKSEDKKILLGVTDQSISKLHVFENSEFSQALDAIKEEHRD